MYLDQFNFNRLKSTQLVLIKPPFLSIESDSSFKIALRITPGSMVRNSYSDTVLSIQNLISRKNIDEVHELLSSTSRAIVVNDISFRISNLRIPCLFV
ncbi:hypothetical protein WK41_32340 [Burkholderia cepacia]|nr:hypothetical protein WK41_32340 [Burkholderia cepacia]